MPDLTSEFLPGLLSNRLPGVDAGNDAVHPAYDGCSIANLPASIGAWLGSPGFGGGPLAGAYIQGLRSHYRNVVVMLVDGLGLKFFQRFLDEEPWKNWLPEARLAALSSIVPSTTTSALTSLWTGVPPALHGIMGYEMWLKEYGIIANMILQSPASFNGDIGSHQRAGFTPAAFLPVPTLGSFLVKCGVEVFAFQPAPIARSGLSTMLLDGSQIVGYRNLSDLWVSLEEVLERQHGNPAYAYVYWSDVDELSHRFGPQDERVRLEFETFSRTLQRFITRRMAHGTGDTLWVLLADHGQIATPVNPHYDLRSHPELLDDLVMVPCGENRLPYLYLRPGREPHVLETLERVWPGEFLSMASSEALTTGLFGSGKPYPKVADRLGDRILFPQGDAYLWWADKANPLRGRHGGLSPQEMLVPLWMMEI